ncbi:MAG: phosphoribosylamine--glycine ligase [Flavobacteriales bacterium]|nr:phosphoribosylamine--glycine ligase [Flavobacteriales bacterium]
MRVLVLGSGGREHAMAWKLSQSSLLDKMFIAPGNAGTAAFGENVDLDIMNFRALADFCVKEQVDMLIVGPEAPLAAGLVDYFKADASLEKMAIVGPNKEAAQLESSKRFSKEFMERHRIPTAKYVSFSKGEIRAAQAHLETLSAPYVIKASGLAAGKGVIITESLAEAKKAVSDMLKGDSFGGAGKEVVIEQFLSGVEVSMFILTDGNSWRMLPSAMDYKRIGDDDTGSNTGGMGAISPVPHLTVEFMEKVKNQVIIPTIRGLERDGIDYCGFIFFGLMKVAGDPYVIEYNVRMGDPETQVVLALLESDLLHLFDGLTSGLLSEMHVAVSDEAAVGVVLASEGYPGAYEKGVTFDAPSLEEIGDEAILFHAGTKMKEGDLDGSVVTSGGRVAACVGLGTDLEKAVEQAYALADKVEFSGKTLRSDIGRLAVPVK